MLNEIWQKYSALHPGKTLTAVLPASVPVKSISIGTIVHSVAAYPTLNEFILRLVDVGANQIDEMCATLGVERRMVSAAIAEELVNGHIWASTEGKFTLTASGKILTGDFKTVKAERRDVTIFRDLVTGRLTSGEQLYSREKDLHPYINEPEDSDQLRIFSLERSEFPPIEIDTFSVSEINNALDMEEAKVVEVITTGKKASRVSFREGFLLCFSNNSLTNITFELVLDDQISKGHAAYLDSQSLIERFDLKFEPKVPKQKISEALSEIRAKAPEKVDDIILAVRESREETEIQLPKNYQQPEIGMFAREDPWPTRVSVFEHPEILDQTLLYSKTRLIIFSPWITGAVVNKTFLKKLQSALNRGVKVTIVYGIGDAAKNTQWSVYRLKEIAAKNANFSFLRHKNTHAKSMIVDDCVIMTSFNWLSFKGSKDRTYRMEEGMKYSGRRIADPWYEIYEDLLKTEATPA